MFLYFYLQKSPINLKPYLTIVLFFFGSFVSSLFFSCKFPNLENGCDPKSESFRDFYLARILVDDDREFCGSRAPNRSICEMDPLAIIQPRRWKYVSDEIRKQISLGSTGVTFSSFTPPIAGTAKWLGGVLSDNQKIYSAPYNQSDVLVINPLTNDTTTLVTGASGTAQWEGGVYAPNGKIYFIPRDADNILVVEPLSNRTYFYLPPSWDLGNGEGACLHPMV